MIKYQNPLFCLIYYFSFKVIIPIELLTKFYSGKVHVLDHGEVAGIFVFKLINMTLD